MQTTNRTSSVKFRNSLITRAGLFFTGLVLMAIMASGYVVYLKSAQVITDHSKQRLKYTNDLVSQSFYAMLDQVSNDIGLLAENPVLDDYISDGSDENKRRLLRLFKSTLANKPSYFQIRYISATTPGLELIRFDKISGEIRQMPDDRLQSKKEHDYYQETVQLPRGGFFYSRINLNEEHGKVDLPHTPTLRAASPIYNRDGNLDGILVINVDLGAQYVHFSQITESGMTLYLMDETGQYLFAPEMALCFSDQLGHGAGFNADYGIPLTAVNKSEQLVNHEGDEFIFTIDTLTYYDTQRRLYLVSMLARDVILESVISVRNDAIKSVLLICLLASILILFLTGIFSRRITKMTRAVTNYRDDQDLHLPEKHQDELGLLARTFNRMSQRIHQQMKALNVALSKEQKAIREKDEFLQNMSHEIRTPLNAIIGLVKVLKKNNPTENQLPILDSLQRSTQNLNGLMHDILDHQKMEEGKISVYYTPTNIYQLLRDIHSTYRYEALSKGLQFNLEVDEFIQSNLLLTDPLRLNQIVTNLVVNAIKYTEAGSISISANYINPSGSHSTLEIQVKDTGVGIPPEQLELINQRFYQVKRTPNTKMKGYGLGLSIVSHLIDLFDGKLIVESTPGAGSIFTVRLSSEVSQLHHANSIQSPSQIQLPTTDEIKTVIHLEDDAPSRHLIQHIVEALPIHLIQVESIESVEERIQSQSADLLISDLILNKQNIGDALLALQSNTAMPVLLVSGVDHHVAKKISAFNIQKPFNGDHLVDFVIKILYREEYDVPTFDSYFSQYDYNNEKIKNFLTILISEFHTYIRRVDQAYMNKDEDEWQAIRHKLATHIQSLNLNKLSQSTSTKIKLLNEATYQRIKNALLYCLCCFRIEMKRLTK